jgi:hypothetical protein
LPLSIERGRKGTQMAVLELCLDPVLYRSAMDMKAEAVKQFRSSIDQQNFELDGDIVIEAQSSFIRNGLDVTIRAFVRKKK